MKRERVKELLPFMQAYADGKIVEYRVSGDSGWTEGTNLDFTTGCEYRVKPVPKLRPYNASELTKLVCTPVIRKGSRAEDPIVLSIDGASGEQVRIEEHWKSAGHLLEYYVHLDGSACGVSE